MTFSGPWRTDQGLESEVDEEVENLGHDSDNRCVFGSMTDR